MMVSLVVLGRPDVIEVAHCYNIDTMVAGEVEATAQLQATCVAQAVPALQLSEQQQELIAVCTHLHLDLLAAVHQERKGINEQMKSALAQCRISSSYDTTGSASSRADPNGAEQAQRIQHRGDLLDRQQQLTSRLTLLLHKEVSCVATLLVGVPQTGPGAAAAGNFAVVGMCLLQSTACCGTAGQLLHRLRCTLWVWCQHSSVGNPGSM
jgi:hypothetical protein